MHVSFWGSTSQNITHLISGSFWNDLHSTKCFRLEPRLGDGEMGMQFFPRVALIPKQKTTRFSCFYSKQ